MTKEQRKNLTFIGMAILREKDIKRGFMDENWKPFNHLLSAKENERCWNYLAQQFMLNILDINGIDRRYREGDRFYNTWLAFLGMVEALVTHEGIKTPLKGIESIVNNSGVARKTWVKFTSAHNDTLKNVLRIL